MGCKRRGSAAHGATKLPGDLGAYRLMFNGHIRGSFKIVSNPLPIEYARKTSSSVSLFERFLICEEPTREMFYVAPKNLELAPRWCSTNGKIPGPQQHSSSIQDGRREMQRTLSTKRSNELGGLRGTLRKTLSRLVFWEVVLSPPSRGVLAVLRALLHMYVHTHHL